MNGIINIYKELGFTSHDVVAKARGILKTKKIGHTGTLDPEAKGVLPICIGRATKASETLLDADKTYIATVKLGITTTTEDAQGEILSVQDVNVSQDEITKAVESFVGEYMQVPPMYSALKVNGKKLYELAREGKTIKRKPRKVHIYSANIIKFITDSEFQIKVECSKGTYIRTLCSDIGEVLETGAHMKSLIRTQVSTFNIEDSITLKQLEDLANNNTLDTALISVDSIYKDLPAISVNPAYNKYLYNGNQLHKNAILEHDTVSKSSTRFRLYDNKDNFIGIYYITTKNGDVFYTPEKIFYI